MTTDKTTTVTDAQLNQMLDSASALSIQHERFVSAVDAERAAEAALLDQITTILDLARKPLSSRLVETHEKRWMSNNTYTDDFKTYYKAKRGLIVLGVGFERAASTRDDSGEFTGTDLIFLDEGVWAKREWTGTWSKWIGNPSIAQSTLTIYANSRAVLADWDLDEIAKAVEAKIAQHLSGNLEKRTKAALQRAEKLTAIVSLLGVKPETRKPDWMCPTHGWNGLDLPQKGRPCNCPHRQEKK